MSLPVTQAGAAPAPTQSGAEQGGAAASPAQRPSLFSRARWQGVGSALRSPATISLLPLSLVLLLFFIVPIVGMAIIAFTVTAEDGSTGVGLDNFMALTSGSHSAAIVNSVQVSLVGSTIAAVIGTLTSFCISQIRSEKLDSVVAVFTSVLANDGGAPLAFSFIVTLGNAGVVYGLLNLGDTGFSLYSWQGLVVMYQYFLIPTMIMVTLPTFVGLRKEWREANAALGGSAPTFWHRVGLPIAMPALLGGWILCFGAAFATHASAAVLIGAGGYPLIPLNIGALLGQAGDSQQVAMALGVTMVAIAVITLFAFNRLQRRSARWMH